MTALIVRNSRCYATPFQPGCAPRAPHVRAISPDLAACVSSGSVRSTHASADPKIARLLLGFELKLPEIPFPGNFMSLDIKTNTLSLSLSLSLV